MTSATVPLYQLSVERRLLLEGIADQDGEITPEQEALLDRIEPAFAAKVVWICQVRQERLLTAESLHREVARLGKRIRTLENGARRLKAYLLDCMVRADEDSLKTPLFGVRVQDSPPTARWTRDLDQLPEAFRRTIPAAVEFDHAAALVAHRNNVPLPEGVVIARGRHIVIS